MKQIMALVFVLVAFVGCIRALPPVQTTGSSSDYSAARCESKESEKERGDCYRERSKLAEQLLESGSKPESHSATPTPKPGAPQPTLFPPPVAPAPIQYAMFTAPVAGNSQNGCGSSYDLVVENRSDYWVEVQAGQAFNPCGNGASLVIIMVAAAPGTAPRPAYVTPPGMKSRWTFDPLRGGHGTQTLLTTAYPEPARGPDGRFLPVPVMAAKRRLPLETELPLAPKGRRFPITNSDFTGVAALPR